MLADLVVADEVGADGVLADPGPGGHLVQRVQQLCRALVQLRPLTPQVAPQLLGRHLGRGRTIQITGQ